MPLFEVYYRTNEPELSMVAKQCTIRAASEERAVEILKLTEPTARVGTIILLEEEEE